MANLNTSTTLRRWSKRCLLWGSLGFAVLVLLDATDSQVELRRRSGNTFEAWPSKISTVAMAIDADIENSILQAQIQTADPADWRVVIRRISLALVGCTPSLEEYRALESHRRLVESSPERLEAETSQWWTDYLLSDSRWSDYFSQRFARAFVGTNQGPFVVFRRRRFETWLADELRRDRPYDAIVRSMITADGLWTGNPAVNFITAAVTREGGRDADPILLTGRTSRAFLGMRIDCLQCHDDLLGKVELGDAEDIRSGKQTDFHQLAAFFATCRISKNPFAGLTDVPRAYRTILRGDSQETSIAPQVPFLEGVLPKHGKPREQLAHWITDDENHAFARATVNRVWAILFGKPLVEPVDDIPLHGPFPPGLEVLAKSFQESNYDLKRLIRTIVATKAFQRDSRLTQEAVTEMHETLWAVFPLTPLRPEQVAASLHQACRLQMIDEEGSIVSQLERFGTLREFTKAYGDRGEDEFLAQSITIPQRLLVMNGKFVRERIDDNPIANAGTQIAMLAKDDDQAVAATYLSTLHRLPTSAEKAEFVGMLSNQRGDSRTRAVGDIFWILLNSTEFLWNH